jgi:PAS domain S-box-containing protein
MNNLHSPHIPHSINREEDARRLLESSFDGIWAIDSELRTSFVNTRMAEMLGYSPQEMLGRCLYDFLFPEDVPAERDAISRRRSGVAEEFELRYRRKDGSALWARIATAPILAADGAFQGAVAIHSDTARRQHMEQALRDRDRELREAERLAGIGSWQWIPDPDLPETDTVVWSEGLYRLAGRTDSHPLRYREYPRLFTLESWSRLDSAVRQVRSDGAPFELDLELLRPDGSTRWVIARAEALRDHEGSIVGLRGTVQDITERKHAEAATSHLAAIVESSNDAIVSKDLTGIIKSWNTAATRIFGYAPEEVIGRSILVLIPPELYAEEEMILRRLRAGERIEHYETERLRKDGQRLQVSVTISPVRDAKGKIIGASKIAHDIGDRKRAEQALLTSEKLATAGRLAATVAHEINNPLESVINLVYLAKRAETDPVIQSYLLTAEEELNRIAHLSKQTLGFYRERSEKTRVRVGDLVRQLVAVFSSRAQNKGLRIDLKIVSNAEVVVDCTEFRQLFANLISNSIDACERGGLIRVRVSVSASGSAEGLRVTVADNGSGIKPTDRPHIFDAFFTTKQDVGTGLGLWICKQIAEKSGGTIRVRSVAEPGRSWTAVSVFLPVTVSAPAPDVIHSLEEVA